MNEYLNWFDSADLIHLHYHPSTTDSENGPLFSAEFHWLYYISTGQTHSKLVRSINTVNPRKNEFRPSAEGGTHFSHDNMTGLYAMYALHGIIPKHLPICKWNGDYWLHPRDIIWYGYMQRKWWATLLFPLLFIIAFVSCIQERGRTSGKCMWWLRSMCTSKLLYTWVIWLCKREHGQTPFTDIFSIYFKEPEHPINMLAKRLKI